MNNIHGTSIRNQQSDANFFQEIGISEAEVSRQRALLTAQQPYRTHADRACTVADGILRVERESRMRYIDIGREAVEHGRLTDFIPASGAATRMFADLLSARELGPDFLRNVPTTAGSDILAGAVLKIFNSLGQFAFYAELKEAVLRKSKSCVNLDTLTGEALLRAGHGHLVISAMVDTDGLGLANRPKALIAFHRYSPGDIRTALAEHLYTASALGTCKEGICRLHFTCSPEHMRDFEREAQEVAERLQRQQGTSLQISFSIQDPSTNTVCIDEAGELVRDAYGNPELRPAGHGALLLNVEHLAIGGADLVYINNVDNVHPENRRDEFIDSKLLLLGLLVETQSIAHEALRALKDGMSAEGIDELYQEISRQVGISIPDEQWHSSDLPAKNSLLMEALNRPVRVVGVVKNTGEAGGGPFWVRGADGRVTRQLVEKHELDPHNKAQQALFNEGTHFNPVRLMCGLRDHEGNPHRLSEFVKDDAVLISEKVNKGHRIKILEKPGLWNGSMEGWITLFVEVDADTFAPVKSVVDLARSAHQCS